METKSLGECPNRIHPRIYLFFLFILFSFILLSFFFLFFFSIKTPLQIEQQETKWKISWKSKNSLFESWINALFLKEEIMDKKKRNNKEKHHHMIWKQINSEGKIQKLYSPSQSTQRYIRGKKMEKQRFTILKSQIKTTKKEI